MRKAQLFSLVAVFITLPLWANTETPATTPSNPDQPKTLPYGENPSLGRVLLYKTGKGIQNIGDSIQQGSEKASDKISKSWSEAKTYGAEQSEVIHDNVESSKQRATQKLQQTKEAMTGSNDSHSPVPITRGELSQSSAN